VARHGLDALLPRLRAGEYDRLGAEEVGVKVAGVAVEILLHSCCLLPRTRALLGRVRPPWGSNTTDDEPEGHRTPDRDLIEGSVFGRPQN
jgi:hypothetical protein